MNSKTLGSFIEVEREIGVVKGSYPGPVLIFTAGIHGNEPAGVIALHEVLKEIREQNLLIKGSLHAISGNLWALERGERYHEKDLNRLWSWDRMEVLKENRLSANNEDERQQLEIFNTIQKIFTEEKGPFYFMDLHTTSSQTVPFLTVNDSLLNRKYTQQFPVPMILGIEEYLDGPLLSYINELGYIAFGFEGGQHDDLASIENHKAFIYLSLVFSGAISKNQIDYDYYFQVLAKTSEELRNIYEIFYRHEIKDNEDFKMEPGFSNFQSVMKGEVLALSNNILVESKQNTNVFMPLYQNQGNDGFFLIRRIPNFYLRLSAFLRKIKFDRVLPLLPGVTWASEKRDALVINRNIAKLFAKQFIHLLGYRSKQLDKTHLIVKNREAASKHNEYVLS